MLDGFEVELGLVLRAPHLVTGHNRVKKQPISRPITAIMDALFIVNFIG